MDSLFENTYTADKSFYQELYSYFHFRRPITVATFILCGICFTSQLALAIFDLEYNIGIMILTALFPLFKLFMYVNQVNSLTKRNKEISTEALSICSTVYEDHLEISASNGSTLNLELSKIRSAVHTKNYVVLRSDARLIYSFGKDGFTKGTKDEFIAFLKSKGIKVSGK